MNEPPRSLFLVGMMGSGKSTIGRLLARACDWPFIDCDHEIEARSGVPIATIFEVEGEDGFRRRETAMLDELTQRAGIVLATGGGAVLRELNRRHLRERGLVIYLQASIDEILRRTQRDVSRPLLQAANRRERLEQLVAERAPLYAQVAHLTFQSGAMSPKKLVRRMAQAPELAPLCVHLDPSA
jgi:shikimate kinase